MNQSILLHRVLPMSKRWIATQAGKGSTVIDATAGNGNDTKFLAELVGEEGHVYAFDIQKEALDSTHARLVEHGLERRVTLIQDSHANVATYVDRPIDAAMFNLGYLPYSDDLSVITRAESTIAAIDAMLDLLKKDGIITVSVYDGHPGGPEERDALMAYVRTLHQKDVHVARFELLNQRSNPPHLLAFEKMRDFTSHERIENN
ncbi:MAG TPA: class I SAM-dependent methyltransferase [Savagea sp.]